MKLNHLIAAGALALTAATAGAQTVIYISGAPAARQPVTTAINNLLTSSTSGAVTTAISGTNTTTLTTANAVTWYGGNIGGTPVTVKLSYVGSSAGIQDVASQTAANFLPVSATASATAYPEPNTAPFPAESHIPNFTASDEFQASTPWIGTNSLTGSSVTYQNLTSNVVGVLPYRWVTNIDAPLSITNISPAQAQQLFKTGFVYLSQLTGANADEGGVVYAIGRDIGSGLRTILLSETGIGVLTKIQQYQPTVSKTGTTPWISTQVLYPAQTVNGVALPTGDSGYSSFSGLLADLSAYTNTPSTGGSLQSYAAALSGTSGYYLTALADADAKTAIAAGAHEISWNGNFLGTLGTQGTASPALAEGKYTFWSYIQLQYLPSQLSNTINPTAFAFEQALKTQLKLHDATVLVGDLNVSRAQDGGALLPNPYNGN